MSDGAHIGVTAERALGTILGDAPQPADEETMSVAEMRDWLFDAPRWNDPAAMADYSECARTVAGEILRWALEHPQRYAHTPAENEYAKDADGRMVNVDGTRFDESGVVKVERQGLYDVLKEEGIGLDNLGLTGFQWGWAYNAARRCLELPPVSNPAIVEL